MHALSAEELEQDPEAALDLVQHEPIVIRQEDREVAVLLSIQKYDSLRHLQRQPPDSTASLMAGKEEARGRSDGDFTKRE